MFKYIFFPISVFIASSAIALVGASGASAATIWDNSIQTTNNLVIASELNSHTKDITSLYDTYASACLGDNQTKLLYQNSKTTSNSHNMTIMNVYDQTFNPSNPARSVYVMLTVDDGFIEFSSNGNVAFAYNAIIIITLSNDNEVLSTCSAISPSLGVIGTDCNYDVNHCNSIFYSTYPVIYPDGYEGVFLPDTLPDDTPAEYRDFVPKWYVTRLVNYQLTISDTNFNTVDTSPFTCEGATTPIVQWEIHDENSSYTETGQSSPTVPIELTLPNTGLATTFEFTGMYSCNGDFDDFTKWGTIYFKIDVNGNLYYNLLDKCFIETFPFVDFTACTNNFQTGLNLMGFRVKDPFVNLGQPPIGDCYTLVVLDEWLNLNNPVICKAVPAYVRDVVTPFISFAIGLMTMKFLATRRRDDL